MNSNPFAILQECVDKLLDAWEKKYKENEEENKIFSGAIRGVNQLITDFNDRIAALQKEAASGQAPEGSAETQSNQPASEVPAEGRPVNCS